MTNAESWSAEIDTSLRHRSQDQLTRLLQQITDWFLQGVPTLRDEHIAVFDDVMGRLIERIEREALIELSDRLAPIDKAPPGVIGTLARNDDIAVSGPVLEQSAVLIDADLVEIAQTKSQSHLSAIAVRKAVSEMVSAVLVGRGDSDVTRKVTENPGARISRHTFESILKRARQDPNLTNAIAGRRDLPHDIFDQLIREATATVRQRLLARATPEMQLRITRALADITARMTSEPISRVLNGGNKPLIPLDLARLRAQISRAVQAGQSDETVDAIAILGRMPVKAVNDVIRIGSAEGLIAICKAGGMAWPDLQELLKAAFPGPTMTPGRLNVLFDTYARLSAQKAQAAMTYIRTTKSMSRTDIARLM